MDRVLAELNEVAGIRGSMVISHDGMVVAAHLGRGLDEEKVAAVASAVVTSTRRSLDRRGLDIFRRLTLNATNGKLVFSDTGNAYLVAVTERDIDLGPIYIEIQSATMRISEATRIRSAD